MDQHPSDDLQLLLDGRLDASRAAQVEAHLAGCARCRRELDALRQVRRALRERLPQVAVPDALAARVRAASRSHRAWGRPAVLAGAGLALATALVLGIVWTRSRVDAVRGAAADFAAYRSGTLVLQRQTAVPAELEQFFREELPFATRVFDFGMMAYQLAGGSVRRLNGRRSALFAYQSAGGDRVVCQMYQGRTGELPSPAEVRDYDGIRFLVYRLEGLTLVFWQEGSVVCVLAAEGDPEQTIALARAKAVKG